MMTARGPSVARSAVAGLACRPGCTSLRSAPPPPRGTDDFPGPCNRPGRPFGRRGGAGREIRLQPYGSRRAAATRTVLGGLY